MASLLFAETGHMADPELSLGPIPNSDLDSSIQFVFLAVELRA